MPDDSLKKDFHVEQLVQEHGKDISGLGEKLGKCYSEERYEDFQNAVEKIVLKQLGSEEGGVKIKKHAEDYLKVKIVGAVLIWVLTIIGSALLQKYFKIFG